MNVRAGEPSGRDRIREVLLDVLSRPRSLRQQTLRHLEDHVEGGEEDLRRFLATAARELEDYEVEILFAPVFTPTPQEQIEVGEPLARHRPARATVEAIIDELRRTVTTCQIALPGGGTAPLAVHEVLIDRYVTLLRLDAAPELEVVDSLRETLPGELVPLTLALLRRKGITRRHQQWAARFLEFARGRHAIDRELVELLLDFLASRGSLDHADMEQGLDSLLRATMEAGTFAQRGRMYWSSEVAEHHQFRGQGRVDDEQIDRAAREIRILETLRADMEAFADVHGSRIT